MKVQHLLKGSEASPLGSKRTLIHDSPYLKILLFSFAKGQGLPIHSHDIEGEVSIQVLKGEGRFLGSDKELPAKEGDLLICDIAEPHGVMAETEMVIIVTIAPPI